MWVSCYAVIAHIGMLHLPGQEHKELVWVLAGVLKIRGNELQCAGQAWQASSRSRLEHGGLRFLSRRAVQSVHRALALMSLSLFERSNIIYL